MEMKLKVTFDLACSTLFNQGFRVELVQSRIIANFYWEMAKATKELVLKVVYHLLAYPSLEGDIFLKQKCKMCC